MLSAASRSIHSYGLSRTRRRYAHRYISPLSHARSHRENPAWLAPPACRSTEANRWSKASLVAHADLILRASRDATAITSWSRNEHPQIQAVLHRIRSALTRMSRAASVDVTCCMLDVSPGPPRRPGRRPGAVTAVGAGRRGPGSPGDHVYMAVTKRARYRCSGPERVESVPGTLTLNPAGSSERSPIQRHPGPSPGAVPRP